MNHVLTAAENLTAEPGLIRNEVDPIEIDAAGYPICAITGATTITITGGPETASLRLVADLGRGKDVESLLDSRQRAVS